MRRPGRAAGRVAVATVLLVAAGAAIAVLLVRRSAHRDVRGSSTVEFVTTQTSPRPTRRPAVIAWPQFGYDASRLHAAPATRVRPPFRVVWVAGGATLQEFPPAIGYGRLFLANAAGHLRAIDARTGAVAWDYDAKHGSAASPAVGRFQHGTVYAAFLHRFDAAGDPSGDGEVVALAVGWGDVRWRRRIGASETSPLLVGDRVYVGDWLGNVYALSALSGEIVWTFHTGGPVKGGLARDRDRVFAGSYDGHVYALNARNGTVIWRARGNGSGTFYSTPAVAYGRVYIGSTNGDVDSFGAQSGKLRWSYRTGGYVYGSPAVWGGRVYIGSYDDVFYALDAATGAVAWRFHANGPISGSGTVINGIVYFATLRGRTYALRATTGRLLWSFPGGKYTPVVADRTQLYLLAHASVYALAPR